jgi:2,3-bisphosphoglycerate-independent phosphoglycerate mutase
VPCMIVDEDNWQLSSSGGLSNVAPTILQLMGIRKPLKMTASSLLLKKLPGHRVPERNLAAILRGVA